MIVYVLTYGESNEIRFTAGVYSTSELAVEIADKYATYLYPAIVREQTHISESPTTGFQSRAYISNGSTYVRFDIIPINLNAAPPPPKPFPGF